MTIPTDDEIRAGFLMAYTMRGRCLHCGGAPAALPPCCPERERWVKNGQELIELRAAAAKRQAEAVAQIQEAEREACAAAARALRDVAAPGTERRDALAEAVLAITSRK